MKLIINYRNENCKICEFFFLFNVFQVLDNLIEINKLLIIKT